MDHVKDLLSNPLGSAKALVALFAAPLTYLANALYAKEDVNPAVLASYCITAILVWAVPNVGN